MNDPSAYAREIERYLCQKNGGHLIRVVGPAFDLVCGWAQTGVPLKVALRGIDRCCDRRAAKGVARRPVRLEFCEADVLDAFDEWRRAVGVTAGTNGEAAAVAEEDAPARRPALAAHIDRVIARLANVRGPGEPTADLHRSIDDAIRELEILVVPAARARGAARAAIVGRLGDLDASLLAAAVAGLDAALTERLRGDAAAELAPFGGRMPAEGRTRALEAAFRRLVREALALPTIAYE